MKKIITTFLFVIIVMSSYGASYRGQLIAKGEKLTIDFKDMEIVDVIRLLSRKFNLNLIAGEDVSGKVTVSFVDVPVDDALETILLVNGYTYIKDGNIIRVESIEKIKEKYAKTNVETKVEEKQVYKSFTVVNQEVKNIEGKINSVIKTDEKLIIDEEANKMVIFATENRINFLEGLLRELDVERDVEEKIEKRDSFRTYKVNYMTSDELVELATELEENFAVKVIVNKNRGNVSLKGKEENVKEAVAMLEELDKAPRQVTIEAKIIELSGDSGVESGINWKYSGDIGNAAGQSIDLDVGKKDVTNGSTDGVDLKFGTIPYSNMEFYLSYLLSTTDANLLSSPNVTTLNGEEAKIHIGESYRYRNNINTTSDSTTTTDTATDSENLIEIVVGITLTVTPTIDSNDKIKLELNQVIDDVRGYTSDNLPITSSREADTTVILNNGDSLIIGGLIKEDEIEVETKVPILGDIPLLGELFKSKKTTNKKNNLIIFINARIVEEKDVLDLSGDESKGELIDKFLLKNEKSEEQGELIGNKE